nr:PREDICTED: uncharacterized protein LOC109042003 [Bemisia tabaci]
MPDRLGHRLTCNSVDKNARAVSVLRRALATLSTDDRTTGSRARVFVNFLSDDWISDLPCVQFSKNRVFHTGIKMSPYEALLGYPARVGLKSTSLPNELLDQIKSEDDLQRLLMDEATEHEDETCQNEVPEGSLPTSDNGTVEVPESSLPTSDNGTAEVPESSLPTSDNGTAEVPESSLSGVPEPSVSSENRF